MNSRPPLLRSRTHSKYLNVKFDIYKPRDWDYQNPKHQVRPEFVLGKSKKRVPEPSHNYFPKDEATYSPINNGWRRELKPAIYRRYILSQAATVPGAVIVEESKIKDDKSQADRKKYIESKNNELLYKLMNYDLNDIWEEIQKNMEKKKKIRSKTQEKIKYNKKVNNKPETSTNSISNGKIVKQEDKKEKNTEKIKVNLRLNRPKRKLGDNKLGKSQNNQN